MPIPYGRQSIDEGDVAAVTEVLRGDWLTQGPAVDAFEADICAAVGAAHAVAFSSGTAALHAAAYAAGLGVGDELITSAITFAASANCGAYVGATPKFADIERESWNIDLEAVGEQLSSATRAVVPVHFAGLPMDVAGLRRIVGPDVRIIEDASHALGAIDAGDPVGACNHSDMAVFSFHPVKAITSAEGGMVTTNDRELRDRLVRFRNHGFERPAPPPEEGGWWYEQHALGFNYRLSDVHSALGSSQLRKCEQFVERRNEIAGRYREELAACGQLELSPAAADGSRHAYHLFVLRHRDGADARRRLYDGLRKREILAQVHYIPVYWHPWYRETFGYQKGLCPEAERYYQGALSLPCFPELTDEQQASVIEALRAELNA